MTDKTVFWEVFVEDDYDYDDYDGEYDDYDDDEIAEAKKWRDDLRKFLSISIKGSRPANFGAQFLEPILIYDN